MKMNPSCSRRAMLAGTLALAASGCWGKFGATNALYDWNKGVSDSKWLRWLVFLLFIILPVYGLFIIADALVLNTIEFFSGDNPVGGGHAELEDGHTLDSKRTSDPNVIRHEHRQHGKLVQVLYMRRVNDDELQLLDEHMRLLARARVLPNGEVELRDPNGKLLSTLDADKPAWKAGTLPLSYSRAKLSVHSVHKKCSQLSYWKSLSPPDHQGQARKPLRYTTWHWITSLAIPSPLKVSTPI